MEFSRNVLPLPCPFSTCACDRSGLSEGEWQRLQLARFLMRADVAKLLLLDEPFKGVSPSESSRMLAALGAHARATGQVRIPDPIVQEAQEKHTLDKRYLSVGGAVGGAVCSLRPFGTTFVPPQAEELHLEVNTVVLTLVTQPRSCYTPISAASPRTVHFDHTRSGRMENINAQYSGIDLSNDVIVPLNLMIRNHHARLNACASP